MTKLPRTITIGPYTYDVTLDKEATDAGNNWGHIHYGPSKIKVTPDVTPMRQRTIALHEVLHGVIEYVGWQNDDEEKLVTSLTPALLETMRRNPDLMAYLLADDETESPA